MLFFCLTPLLLATWWFEVTETLALGTGNTARIKPYKRDLLQDLVTWDEHSLFVRGERIMLFSGEFHPFRLPVPGLWLDVFQKIKALGFTGVSFYTDWGLLEGNPGHMMTDGIFSLDEFFQAATETGIYLVARPGPYINAETAAGGFPGWLLTLKGVLRSTAPDYLNATQNYISTIGKIIAAAQITNGGPVILVQPENEYTTYPAVTDFPDSMNREYMAFIEQSFRDAGIVVPFIVNDNEVQGYFAPGSGLGAMDIYGIDAYPLRYTCAEPYAWPTDRFPMPGMNSSGIIDWTYVHDVKSPSTPFSISEFQGGSQDPWGGVGEDLCGILINNEAERILYKNNYAFGATLFNIYMMYGGTNWGNLGYDGGYTSYDYGAAITEDRLVWREKYSELKLQANFLKASPAYMTATPGIAANGSYASTNLIAVTPLMGNGTDTNFYVTRHANFTSLASTAYQLTVSTSLGNFTLPQLGGVLTLNGRDSKIHVTDYDVGGIDMIYSTAEVFTWANSTTSGRVLVLYGGEDEIHEVAFPASIGTPTITEGSGVTFQTRGSALIVHWQVQRTRQSMKFGNTELEVHLLWRNEAYNYWVLELPAAQPVGNYTSLSKQRVVVKAGYLLRSAEISGNQLSLTGDINATTDIEVISVPIAGITELSFNGQVLNVTQNQYGRSAATITYSPPSFAVPDFSILQWRYLDSLPEIHPTYDDSAWTSLTKPTTNNPQALLTPTSLYASDYGFHTGSLLYRGHFIAIGQESDLTLNTTGGTGFGHSVWLNSTFLGSWPGSGSNASYIQNFTLPTGLLTNHPYTLTILIDHMGQTEEAPGTDAIKAPHGIINYSIPPHAQTDITWKMTGNLGGQQYYDLVRGPRNEGAMYAERQGYHLPNPPAANWSISNPIAGRGSDSDINISAGPGVGFYTTTFELDVPAGYDIPMSFVFYNTSSSSTSAAPTTVNPTTKNFRCQLFVNGYQFGKFVNNLGPQSSFPVPEGILNYNGSNTVALTVWTLDPDDGGNGGGILGDFKLVVSSSSSSAAGGEGTGIWSGYKRPSLVPMPSWTKRSGAY